MKQSITRMVRFLEQNCAEKNSLPSREAVFEITSEYLYQSKLSPDYHPKLLKRAAEAKHQGLVYVDVPNCGRSLTVSPESLLEW